MPTPDNPITTARLAIWGAIEATPELQGSAVFKKKYGFRDEITSTDENGPDKSDVPAIEVFTTDATFSWNRTKIQKGGMNFSVRIWTPKWELLTPEDLLWQIRSALWTAKSPNDNLTVIERATCYLPDQVTPMTFKRVKIGDGQQKAIEATMRVRLVSNRVTIV